MTCGFGAGAPLVWIRKESANLGAVRISFREKGERLGGRVKVRLDQRLLRRAGTSVGRERRARTRGENGVERRE